MAKRIELKGERRVTSHNATFCQPTWSPDGRLVLEAEEKSRSLYVVDGKGRVELRLGEGSEASWSPEGSRVAYTRIGSDGRKEIWVSDVAADAAAVRLAGGDGGGWEHPTWSPDGQRVACVSDFGNPGGIRHVWVLDAAQGDRQRVTCDPQRSDGHPSFSPDGRALAFDGDDHADDAREIDVYALDLASGGLVRLTDGAVPTRRPVFIDRRYLLAERRSVSGPTLVVLDRVKKRTLPVGEAPGGERSPAVRLEPPAKHEKYPTVWVAFVRRGEGERDAVWVAELRGLKAVLEETARLAERDAEVARVEAAGLPVLPALPPASSPASSPSPSGLGIIDLYDDEAESSP